MSSATVIDPFLADEVAPRGITKSWQDVQGLGRPTFPLGLWMKLGAASLSAVASMPLLRSGRSAMSPKYRTNWKGKTADSLYETLKSEAEAPHSGKK
ncbi:hypothetical protein [Bradyrhizobium macuxiense]|uniref:hypothetical protein n=1 Tax=Bradyrhizobium macuxiense TaxID=1755647 RepID=UPI0011BD8153|nr:hypothetical protein [Bradyrhizobium macuxiense]